jgi:hypothetical protein
MDEVRATERRLNGAYQALRVGLGASMIVVGVDKFLDLLATWSMYLCPLAESLLFVSAEVFLRAVGVLEIAIGVAVLSPYTRLGAYALAGWLLCIALNLALAGSFWDLVVRDLVTALAGYTLARLAEWRAEARGRAPAREQPLDRLEHGEAKI